MRVEGKEQRALWFEDGKVKFIDQRKLPYNIEIYTAKTVDDIAFAIKDMVVRGAPAIGAAAAYGMVLGKNEIHNTSKKLQQTRPTAYDLFYAINFMEKEINNGKNPLDAANRYVEDIINRCKKIGENGEKLIKDDMSILTHCNAGALATVDYGTALGVIRAAIEEGKKIKVISCETRPRLQGAKLTCYELMRDNIPVTLISDTMVGYVMSKGLVDKVVVGADRIVRDAVLNKIGTYNVAVLAAEHGIPFYVAAPISTMDQFHTSDEAVIEERSPTEVTNIGSERIAPEGIKVLNPAFDITPLEYVDAVITEEGILTPDLILKPKRKD